jgi:hypothetical protein
MGATGVGTAGTGGIAPAVTLPPPDGDRTRTEPGSRPPPLLVGRTLGLFGGAFAAYLVVSVALWWNVWSSHPTAVTTCGCGDTSLFLWFLEWPAYALAHGHDLFFSTALFHPGGINLLSNTSVLAIGVVLAPVTWLFGPVATMNVASTLAPVLSALTMFWLLRRWVRWAPAAFVGGLVFGFSPFVVVSLAGAHLMSGTLVLLPLMVACLDELLVRQERSPVKTGVVFGLVVVLQFFVSTEVLVMAVMCGVAGVVVLVVYAAIRRQLAARAPSAGRGLLAAGVVAVCLLAYPVWFALDGPAHLAGLVWPTLTPGLGGIAPANLFQAHPMTALRAEMLVTGGYQGPSLPHGEYLGPGLIAVVVVGVLVWRNDRRLWFFGTLGVVAVVASLGVKSYWTPWRILAHVPLVQNIVADRFAAITSLCAAVMLAVVIDRTRGSVSGVAGALVAFAVAAVAVVSMASALAGNFPLTTSAVTLPRWYAAVGAHLPPGQVVLAYPAPFAFEQSAEGWQAVDSLGFALVGGSGPGSLPERAGAERAGQEVVGDLTFSVDGPPTPTGANVDAVRRALTGWGVTLIVVSDPSSLPRYEQGTDPAAAIGLFTLAVGRSPRFYDGTWVWSGVRSLGPPLTISPGDFAGCTAPGQLEARSPLAIPDCVLAASRPSP